MRLRKATLLLGAAEARVADADRPGSLDDVAEVQDRAVGVGHRALAAELVEAPALAMALVAELLAKRPASKCARRGQCSWMVRP